MFGSKGQIESLKFFFYLQTREDNSRSKRFKVLSTLSCYVSSHFQEWDFVFIEFGQG